MAAAEHLGQQFVNAHELQNMESGDFPGMKVGDLKSDQQEGMYKDYDWKKLHQDLDRDGMQTPLTIEDRGRKEPTLENGHHRAVAGMERGQMFYPVTDRRTAHEGPYRHTKELTLQRQGHPWAKFHNAGVVPKNYSLHVHPDQGKLF